MKLLNGPRPLLEVNPLHPIPLRQMHGHHVDVRRVIDINDIFEAVELILQCNSSLLWALSYRGELREIERDNESGQRELSNDDNTLEWRRRGMIRKKQSFQLEVFSTIHILCRLYRPALQSNSMTPAAIAEQFIRNDKFKLLLQSSSLDSLIRLAALISCGLGVSAFEWSKRNLTPLLVKFRGGSFLGLAPSSVFTSNSGHEFVVLKAAKFLGMGRWALVAWDSKVKSEFCNICLFPADTIK
jgi:hypothetical protein